MILELNFMYVNTLTFPIQVTFSFPHLFRLEVLSCTAYPQAFRKHLIENTLAFTLTEKRIKYGFMRDIYPFKQEVFNEFLLCTRHCSWFLRCIWDQRALNLEGAYILPDHGSHFKCERDFPK